MQRLGRSSLGPLGSLGCPRHAPVHAHCGAQTRTSHRTTTPSVDTHYLSRTQWAPRARSVHLTEREVLRSLRQVTHMAMSILEKGEAGEFIIRDKKGEPNCYGISIKVSGIFFRAGASAGIMPYHPIHLRTPSPPPTVNSSGISGRAWLDSCIQISHAHWSVDRSFRSRPRPRSAADQSHGRARTDSGRSF